jgi:hypothetical protein
MIIQLITFRWAVPFLRQSSRSHNWKEENDVNTGIIIIFIALTSNTTEKSTSTKNNYRKRKYKSYELHNTYIVLSFTIGR